MKLVFLSFEILHLLVGGSTGTVLAAVQQLAPEFSRGDTIVAISADLGEKYLDTVYDPAWVEKVIVPEGNSPRKPMRPSRPSEAQKKRLISPRSQPAPWRNDML